jgi:hypothetical protein
MNPAYCNLIEQNFQGTKKIIWTLEVADLVNLSNACKPSGNLIVYTVNYFFLSEHVEEQLAQSLQVVPSLPLVARKVRPIMHQYISLCIAGQGWRMAMERLLE